MTAGQWLSAYALGILSGCGLIFLLVLLVLLRMLRRETKTLSDRGKEMLRSAGSPRPTGIPGA